MDWVTHGFLDGLGTVGTWALVGMALIFDKGIALKREVTQLREENGWLRKSNEEKDAALFEALTGNRIAVKALDKISDAAASGSEGV